MYDELENGIPYNQIKVVYPPKQKNKDFNKSQNEPKNQPYRTISEPKKEDGFVIKNFHLNHLFSEEGNYFFRGLLETSLGSFSCVEKGKVLKELEQTIFQRCIFKATKYLNKDVKLICKDLINQNQFKPLSEDKRSLLFAKGSSVFGDKKAFDLWRKEFVLKRFGFDFFYKIKRRKFQRACR
jgi:hypothetical protein